MQPTDHPEYRGHPDRLGPPSSVSMWEISTSLTVLSDQTHPWERAWDELVSSNQSCTKSKGKATPASKGQSLLSNRFVFSFKGTNYVGSDFSSWLSTRKNRAMSCQEDTTSTQKYYVIFPPWMTADDWPEGSHKQHAVTYYWCPQTHPNSQCDWT